MNEAEIRDLSLKEITEEIDRVKEDIVREKKIFNRRAPKTTNSKIRAKYTETRAKSKRYIEHRTNYLKELIQRRMIVESVALNSVENDKIIARVKELNERDLGKLYGQLAINLRSSTELGTISIESIEKALNGEKGRADMVKDIVLDYLKINDLVNEL